MSKVLIRLWGEVRASARRLKRHSRSTMGVILEISKSNYLLKLQLVQLQLVISLHWSCDSSIIGNGRCYR